MERATAAFTTSQVALNASNCFQNAHTVRTPVAGQIPRASFTSVARKEPALRAAPRNAVGQYVQILNSIYMCMGIRTLGDLCLYVKVEFFFN